MRGVNLNLPIRTLKIKGKTSSVTKNRIEFYIFFFVSCIRRPFATAYGVASSLPSTRKRLAPSNFNRSIVEFECELQKGLINIGRIMNQRVILRNKIPYLGAAVCMRSIQNLPSPMHLAMGLYVFKTLVWCTLLSFLLCFCIICSSVVR